MNKIGDSNIKSLQSIFITFLSKHSYIRWFIFITSVLVYINSVPNKWAVDDIIVVHGNKYVKRGVSGIDSIFTQETFSGFFGQNNTNAVAGGRWRPLSLAIFAIEAELFASVKKDNKGNIEKDKEGFVIKDLSSYTVFPHILHLINVLLYGGLCVVLYNVLLLLFNPQKDISNVKANFVAATTALLFAVHPIHTEVVANVKGSDEILTLLGTLLAVFSLLKAWYATNGDNKARIKWWFLAGLLYFLALLAKESATTFLLVVPLVFWFFTTAKLKEIAILTSPLIVLFLLFFAMRSSVLGVSSANTYKATEMMNNPFLVLNPQSQYAPLIQGNTVKKLINYKEDTYTPMPFVNELATNFYTWGVYLKLLVLPYPLTSDYYPRHIEVKDFADPWVLLSIILNIGLLVWAISQIKRRNPFSFGILYYFATFSIVSNLFFPIGTNMAERLVFMPSVGICLVMALGFFQFSQKAGFNKILIAIGSIAVVYAFLTIARNTDWKNDFTLSSKDVLTSKNSAKIKVVYAAEILSKATRDVEKELPNIVSLRIEEQKIAIKALQKSHDAAILTAIPYLKEALEIHPIFNSAWAQLGAAYFTLAKSQNNTPNQTFNYLLTALEAYKQADYYKGAGTATYINKDMAELYLALGKFYGETLSDIDKSIIFLEKAKTLNTESADVYFLLGTAYSMKKDYQNMLKYAEKSFDMLKNDSSKKNLATAYQIVGASTNNKELFVKAEKMLLEIYEAEQNSAKNTSDKNTSILRTLDLIQRNYTLQGNSSKLAFYKSEMAKFQK